MIRADVEDHAPHQTDSGLLTATTLAAAVEGADTEDSWFVGTIVAMGPLVNHFNCRKFVLRQLQHVAYLANEGLESDAITYAAGLLQKLSELPTDCPDPLCVGDRVCFSWASGQQMTLDDDRFLIMDASAVLAVLDKD